MGAGDVGIQLGDFLLEQAQQATRPPWEVFEQELEVRVGLALRDGSDPVDLLEQDEARKALARRLASTVLFTRRARRSRTIVRCSRCVRLPRSSIASVWVRATGGRS